MHKNNEKPARFYESVLLMKGQRTRSYVVSVTYALSLGEDRREEYLWTAPRGILSVFMLMLLFVAVMLVGRG